MLETDGLRRSSRGIQSFLAFLLTLGGFSGSILYGSSDSSYGQIPLTFIANRGQVHSSVRFTAQSPGLSAYFTPGEVVLDVGSAVIRMRYLGASISPAVEGLDLQEGKANYILGNDPKKWKTNVPLFGRLVYRDLYPGIDMLYLSSRRRLKSEFVVAPGADPSRIRIAYTGAGTIRVDETGGLIFNTPDGELREAAPEIYQELDGRREPVNGAFQVSGEVVSFLVGDYDRDRELRIDPVLSYSTYLGGSGTNKGTAIAVDSANAAYITGYTDSTNFPVTGGVLQPASGGNVDVFITKLNAAGSAIVYSTYLGGSGDDRGFSIAVDASGNAYVTGYTASTNFPLVAAVQTFFGGVRDAFVVKLNSTGSALLYSTYLGGSGTDSGNGIAIDAGGACYITGSTTSTDFPSVGAFQSANGGGSDAFVTKLNAAGSLIVYSTYLGGSADDRGSAIAVDSSGNPYIAGNTNSINFPIFSPLQASNGGATDAFIAKLNSIGASLLYSTYLGGSGVENVELGRSIAVDSAGSAYLTGMTASANFPTYLPMQASLGGGNDAFVVKLNPAGSAFVYSTFLGGSGIDYGESIAIDSSLNAYVAGYTSSVDFPAVNADQPVNGGAYDAFIAKLNVSGSALTDTDLLGGSGSDAAYGIALDSSASAYLAGQTGSSNFPLKTPAQSSLGTTTLAAFVAKFTFGATGPPTAVSVTPPGSSGASQTFTLVYSDARGFADINWVEMNWNATLSTANACYVHYDRSINTIRLSTDAGSGWIGSGVLGSAGILQNSQCLLDVGASSFSGAGGSLTVNLALTFKAGFAGAKNIYMQVQDNANTLTAWQARGTWTVVAAGPANVSVAPASGSGANQTFSFVYSDPYGNADINWAQMHFQTQLVSQNACYLQYTRASNVIQLVNDSGGGYAGSAAVGIAGSLNNSQCTLDTGASSVAVSGNNLTLNLALIFKPAFAGAKNISMGVVNNANVFSGWQVKGTWTVAAGGSLPAANVSVTPASGAGSSQTFSFVYSDAYAYTDINWVQMHLQTQLVADHACYLQYTRASNSIQLINDAGTGYVGTGSTVGSIGTLANGQCTLDTGASSVSGAGNNLTVTLALSFTASFQGPKTISMGAVTNSYVFSGWQAKGSWTATQAGNLPPVNNSVTPSSGAGSNQMFGFAYSDPYGFTDIALAQMHFQTQLVGNNACYLQYTRATNTIQLFNDAGTGFVGSGGVLGGAGTLANSQCTLNLGSSSSSGAGNNLTVNLALTFMPLFNGAKTASMNASNNATISAGWQAKGTWTVQ